MICKLLSFQPLIRSTSKTLELLRKYCGLSDSVKKIGWVQNIRNQKKMTFIDLLDGKSSDSIQVVVPSAQCPHINHGCCISVSGQMKPHKKLQNINELVATNVVILGDCASEHFPISNTFASLSADVSRHSALHLRHRRSEFASVLRLRSALKKSIRSVMDEEGYLEVDTPILTTSDCEGAGEVFGLANKEFFGKEPVSLTVSAQLHLEVASSGLAKVYTLSPTFRADKSLTRHHLSEFYMLEVESIYVHTSEQLCDEIEANLKSIIRHLTQYSSIINSELPHIWKKLGSDKSQFIEFITSSDRFHRLTFKEALNVLLNAGDALDEAVDSDAVDFTKKQEQYLTSILGNVPVFITDFPAISKPFYCLKSEASDSSTSTAASVDLLLPEVGEIVGGSVREHRLNNLLAEMEATSAHFKENLHWYSDLRKYGTCPHGGYGLGIDRLLQCITGIHNLRDVVFLPRSYEFCLL